MEKPGTFIRVDEKGARQLPWQQAATEGEVGKSKFKRPITDTKGLPPPPPIVKTSARAKAEKLTTLLVIEIEKMRHALGRPVVSADLSDQWLRALGIKEELWKVGEPVTDETLRRVAEHYLEAVAMSGGQPLPQAWAPVAK